jgi:hypothetical protein
MGPSSYYFPDPHGLSFFDRLENKTNYSSTSPTSARMSTFIIYDVLSQEHGNNHVSMLDHEYFNSTLILGLSITSKGSTVTVPGSGTPFYISSTYEGYLGLSPNY